MARQNSPRQFLRQVPRALLARQLREHHRVLAEGEFDKLEGTDISPRCQALTHLSGAQQAAHEKDRLIVLSDLVKSAVDT